MQWTSSTTNIPSLVEIGSRTSSTNSSFASRSGETRSTSAPPPSTSRRRSGHSSRFVELMDTARTASRRAISIWLRIRARSGDTMSVGPCPELRKSRVAMKYTVLLPQPVRSTTSCRTRRLTKASIASHCPLRNEASATLSWRRRSRSAAFRSVPPPPAGAATRFTGSDAAPLGNRGAIGSGRPSSPTARCPAP